MTANYDTDPNTDTIAAAWASSPLGQPERDVRYGFATAGPTDSVITANGPKSSAKRALLAAALASGVIGGAAFGVMLFDYTDPAQSAVVVPGSGVGLSAPETSGASSSSRLPGPPRALPGEPLPAPEGAPSPNPVVSVPDSAQQGPADVAVPGDRTVVIDIPIPEYPPLPEKPEDPDPEPPKPQPPVLENPNLKLPEPPKPKPEPDPPGFLPDLPLAPMPNPDPTIKLPLVPLIPSPKLNPQPEPPSVGLNPQPEPPSAGLNPQPEPPSAGLNPQPEPPSAGLNPQPEPPKSPPFIVDPVLPKW